MSKVGLKWNAAALTEWHWNMLNAKKIGFMLDFRVVHVGFVDILA